MAVGNMLRINRNMRCIEMVLTNGFTLSRPEINRNMRCIEMLLPIYSILF